MSLVSGSTSMISRSSAEICSNEKVKKLLRVQLKRALAPSQSKNHNRKLKSSSKTGRKRVLRPQGRSCLSSPSPPPGAWWRFLGRGRAGSVSSGGSHIWNVNYCINKSLWAGYNLQVFFLPWFHEECHVPPQADPQFTWRKNSLCTWTSCATVWTPVFQQEAAAFIASLTTNTSIQCSDLSHDSASLFALHEDEARPAQMAPNHLVRPLVAGYKIGHGPRSKTFQPKNTGIYIFLADHWCDF